MASQPDEKSDDPKDLATYRHAERTIGDYKLKSGSDYVVPEDQRVTATKKRHQLLLLRNEILTRKNAFNSHLLSLRERKKLLIGQVGGIGGCACWAGQGRGGGGVGSGVGLDGGAGSW